MGTSSSRLDQLESLVRSLRSTNAQLERQLLTVGVEADATKRADLIRIIQAENEKLMRENERNHLQLADELRKLRSVTPPTMGTDGGRDGTTGLTGDATKVTTNAESERIGAIIDDLTARLRALLKRNKSPDDNGDDEEEKALAAASASSPSPTNGTSREEQLQVIIQALEQRIASATEEARSSQSELAAVKSKLTSTIESNAAQTTHLQAALEIAEVTIATKAQCIADSTTEYQRLCEEKAVDERQHRAAAVAMQEKYEEKLASLERKYLDELDQCEAKHQAVMQEAEQTVDAKLASKWVRIAEQLARDHGRAPRCLTDGCSEPIARQASAIPGGPNASSSPSPSSSPPAMSPCAVCTPVQRGEGESNPPGAGSSSSTHDRAATYFCSNGHTNQCDACWMKQVEAVCADVVAKAAATGAVTASSSLIPPSASAPSEALMVALPPLAIVPEAVVSAVQASKIAFPATSSAAAPSLAEEAKEDAATTDGDAVKHASQLVRRACPSCEHPYQADAGAYPQAIPRLLQCAHTLCTSCAQRDLEQARSSGASLIRCCVCTQPTMLSELPDGGALPEATAITELVLQLGSQTSTGAALCQECSEEEAAVHCEECVVDVGPLCRGCFADRHQSKRMKDHVPKPLTAAVTTPQCVVHKKPLTQFCSYASCWTPLCDACVADHKADREMHVVVELESFAEKYRLQAEVSTAANTALTATSSLVHTQAEWFEQSLVAQRQAKEIQQRMSEQAVVLVTALQAKVEPYIRRGILRRAKIAQTLSQVATLKERVDHAFAGGPLTLLRLVPIYLRQVEELRVRALLEQQDVSQLNLEPYSYILHQVPNKIAEIGPHVQELMDAPVENRAGHLLFTWGDRPGNGQGQFQAPCGLAVCGGLVYVADHQNHRVQVFNASDGTFVRTWGSEGNGSEQFKHPFGVAVSGGLAYVTEVGNHRVQVFNASDGTFVRTWGSEGNGSEQFKNPFGVAVSGGLVYVADHINHRVQVFNASDGTFVRTWSSEGNGSEQFKNPFGIAVSGGLAFITDAGNHRVQVFNASDGTFVRTWGGRGSGSEQFMDPRGIAVSGGLVYVADSGSHRVQVFNASDGTFVRTWGSEGNGSEQFKHPQGIAVTGGLAYVTDCGNHRLQVFRC